MEHDTMVLIFLKEEVDRASLSVVNGHKYKEKEKNLLVFSSDDFEHLFEHDVELYVCYKDHQPISNTCESPI